VLAADEQELSQKEFENRQREDKDREAQSLHYGAPKGKGTVWFHYFGIEETGGKAVKQQNL